MDTDILIIGGGLSGLALAEALVTQGQSPLLVEARDRLGGRIKTAEVGGGYYDLGPSWFWPGQPRIAALVERFGLTRFDQFAQGILSFEDERGQVQRGRGFASMEGSWRLKGGLGALVMALESCLPDECVRLDSPVVKVMCRGDAIIAVLSGGETIASRRAVLALPPRIGAQFIFEPALPDATVRAMQAVPTWMAGQAKAVAIYDRPFWRDAGLSGDAMSRHGPLVEIHDASPDAGGPYALFGFVGVPPAHRQDNEALQDAVIAQLTRLFGPDAAAPRQLIVKDWAHDPYTATELDQTSLAAHPDYGLPVAMQGLWDDRLLFAGTEVAAQFGGYIEGALEAAERALNALISDRSGATGHVS
jgi:monoamine oxidase